MSCGKPESEAHRGHSHAARSPITPPLLSTRALIRVDVRDRPPRPPHIPRRNSNPSAQRPAVVVNNVAELGAHAGSRGTRHCRRRAPERRPVSLSFRRGGGPVSIPMLFCSNVPMIRASQFR